MKTIQRLTLNKRNQLLAIKYKCTVQSKVLIKIRRKKAFKNFEKCISSEQKDRWLVCGKENRDRKFK